MGVHYPNEFIDELLSQVDMMDIMQQHGVQVRRGSGENNYYVASFCCGKKDFQNGRIRKSTQHYKCLSCNNGGNAIHFLREVAGLSFHEAISELIEITGIEPPVDDSVQDTVAARRELALSLTVKFYQSQNNLDYMLSRGISREVLQKYKVGYAPGGRQLRDYLEKHGFTKQELLDFRLLNSKGLDRFFYRAIVPIYMFGKVVDLYGRTVNDNYQSTTKHFYLYGDIPFLGGYDYLKSGKQVLIFESFIDQLVAESHGLMNGTNPGGAKKFVAEHGRLLRKKTDNVLFLYDGDQAGNDGALSAGRILTEKGINTSVAELPSGQDPAEIIHNQGIDAFKNSIKVSTYRRLELRNILKNYSLDEIEEYVQEIKKQKH